MANIKRLAKIRQTSHVENEDGSKEWTEHYLAETDEHRGAIAAIKRERPDFARFQPHPEDEFATVRSIKIDNRKHSTLWDIELRYSTAGDEDEDNPLEAPARISLSSTTENIAVYKDSKNEYLINTAGSLIEGIEEPMPLTVFEFRKTISAWPSWLLDYREAVNSDAVFVKGLLCQPRTLKIASLSIGDESTWEDIPIAELSMTLVHNKETWDRFFLNRGFEEVVIQERKVDGKTVWGYGRVRCTDKNEQPCQEPQFLDESGRRPRVDPKTGKLVTLAEELKAAKAGKKLQTALKSPLDPADIIVLRKSLRPNLPFQVFPLN